ncbi:MAG: hypothetical protein MUF34_23900 [Polyangiaceae bacterium]|nr:hypothetical protein [Polyangiaceae bacterium]
MSREDGYWGSTGGVCDYDTCEAAYGPASNPAPARDFVIREAYQDRLLVDRTSRQDGVPDPDCCFPTLVSYRIRTHNTWTLLGSAVGFQHRTVVDADTGRCVDEGVDPVTGGFCDPLLALRNGRAYEVVNAAAPAGDPNAPLLIEGDPRQPCRTEFGAVRDGIAAGADDCFAPPMNDRIVFRNEVMSFVVYAGEQPSRRDMSFGWSASGGFAPLQVNMNVRAGLVAPFGTVYSPSQQRLIVTDGGQSGVFSINLNTFGFRSYL